MTRINRHSSGIKIEGHRGKWYVISSEIRNTIQLFLLEHETYGEDADSLIVTADGKIIMENVCNGFDDLPEVFYL